MTPLLAWIHPPCSKSRGLLALLAESGRNVSLRHYQDDPPTTEELRDAVRKLQLEHPRELARSKEALFEELGLAEASEEEVFVALAANPSLIQRPILFSGERALIARPPEKAIEWLEQVADA